MGVEVDDTLQVQADPQREWRPSGLDLVVDGQYRWPLCQPRTKVGSDASSDLVLPGGGSVVLHFEGEKVYVTSLGAPPPLLNGQAVGLAEFKPGDVLTLGPHTLRLVALAPPAFLEQYGSGQIFMLGPGDTTIGRPGRRANRVELEDKTISRSHATISRDFVLQAESEHSLCQVNGETVSAGASRQLADGDLVGLGKLLFRFRLTGAAGTGSDRRLRIFSLGPLRVFRGQEAIAENIFRSQACRHVLAFVAQEWDRPVPVELLLDMFWPDLPPDKARRNLNWTVSTLRQTLRAEGDEGDYLVRTHQTVQLDPEVLGSHDLVDLRHALAEGPARLKEGDATLLRLALELYRGPFLEGCYLDWALNRRTQLEQDLMAAGLTLLAADLGASRWAEAAAVARRLVQVDGCCQEAYLGGMQAARQQGRPEEALRLFEQCQAVLRRELDIEPGVELTREKLLCV